MKEQTADIVAAYLRHNIVGSEQLPELIHQVHSILSGLGQPVAEPVQPLSPAVPIRRSVSESEITCLDCGYEAKMLRRHISAAHGLTPQQYRERWKLPSDYPMTSKAYSARRSALAKAAGLGKRGGPRTARRGKRAVHR